MKRPARTLAISFAPPVNDGAELPFDGSVSCLDDKAIVVLGADGSSRVELDVRQMNGGNQTTGESLSVAASVRRPAL